MKKIDKEDIEKEATLYAKDLKVGVVPYTKVNEDKKAAFIAGAQWLKDQLLDHDIPYMVINYSDSQGVRFVNMDNYAIGLVFKERLRQIDVEGFDVRHDEDYSNEELARAGASYALPEGHRLMTKENVPVYWPKNWGAKWWKPTNRLRDLVKAGALIIAAIDRLIIKTGEQEDEQGTGH